MLRSFGITDADQDIHELSHGQRRLAAVVQSLTAKPRLLVLDEPFSNLDSGAVKRLKRALKDFVECNNGHSRRSIIFVEHVSQRIEGLATRIIHFGDTGLQMLPAT